MKPEQIQYLHINQSANFKVNDILEDADGVKMKIVPFYPYRNFAAFVLIMLGMVLPFVLSFTWLFLIVPAGVFLWAYTLLSAKKPAGYTSGANYNVYKVKILKP